MGRFQDNACADDHVSQRILKLSGYAICAQRGVDRATSFSLGISDLLLIHSQSGMIGAKEIGMAQLNIDAVRAKIRAMEFQRGTPDEIAQWREDDRDSRHNLVIEGMDPQADEDALFAMMMDEGVPPALASKLVVDMLTTNASQLAA